MSGKVIFHVKNGSGPTKDIVIANRTMCTVGRSKNCFLRIPEMEVSRQQCVLDVDPPHVRVRDLGSQNGTFLNGDLIGQRQDGQSPEESHASEMPAHELKEGDVVSFASVLILVKIENRADAPVAENELAVGV